MEGERLKNTGITKKDYFSVLWQGKRLIVLSSIIAAVAVLVVFVLAPKSYQGSSIITLRGRNLMTSGMSTNMRSPYTNSAYIADIINEPSFSVQVFSKVKSSKQKGSFLGFLSGRQIIARRDMETNIVYVYAYGRTAGETKQLADEAIKLINERVETINTSSPAKIQKEIYEKLLNPLIRQIDEISSNIEVARSKKANVKTSTRIARFNRELSSLERKRGKYEDYLADVTLSDMTSRPRLEVVMAPVISRQSKRSTLFQVISSAFIGLIFGVSLVLVKDFIKERD